MIGQSLKRETGGVKFFKQSSLGEELNGGKALVCKRKKGRKDVLGRDERGKKQEGSEVEAHFSHVFSKAP